MPTRPQYHTLQASTRTLATSLAGTSINVSLFDLHAMSELHNRQVNLPGCLDTWASHLEAIELLCHTTGIEVTALHPGNGWHDECNDTGGITATVELA